MLLARVSVVAKVVGRDDRAVLASATRRPDFALAPVSFAHGVRVGRLGRVDGVDVRDDDGTQTDDARDCHADIA